MSSWFGERWAEKEGRAVVGGLEGVLGGQREGETQRGERRF